MSEQGLVGLSRSDIELIDAATLRKLELRIESCEACNPDEAEFASIMFWLWGETRIEFLKSRKTGLAE